MPLKPTYKIYKTAFQAVLVVFFILSAFSFSAQSVGYLGKKLILKTNVVNGMRLGFNNLDLEYVLGRKFSVNLFYENLNYTRGSKGVKRRTGSVQPRSGDGDYTEYSILKNGRTKGWLVGLGGKVYFNSIIPAPYGYYFAFSFGYGHVSLSEFNVSYEYKAKITNADQDDILEKPEVTGLNGETSIYFAELPAFGYQRIFKHFITLDSKIAIQTQYCKLPDNLLNAFEHNYYVRSNTVGYGFGNFSVGLAVYVKIGFLIF